MAAKTSSPRKLYRSRLYQTPDKFLETLSHNIMQGPPRRPHVLLQLDLLQANDLTDLLIKHRVKGDESLLQLAAIFHGDQEVMSRLATLCPQLLLLQRQGDYEGQNVLHTLVSKQNVEAVSALLDHPCLTDPRALLKAKAVGPRFVNTVMMGELPLSIAALTFNVDMVDVLLQRGAKLHATNTQGDTALHSLVRFAYLYREKTHDVERMLLELHERLKTSTGAASPQADPRSVWMLENKDGLTVLQLAAALAVPSVFRLILQLEGVYSQLDQHDGLFDSLLYDVTEIDPVARRHWRSVNQQRGQGARLITAEGLHSTSRSVLKEIGCCPGADAPAPSAMNRHRSGGRGRVEVEEGRSASVLEIICETGRVEKAFGVLNTYVVRSIIKEKWWHYVPWFVAWAVVHVLFMVLLTAHAVYKARLIATQGESQASSPLPNTTSTSSPSTHREEAFVMAMTVLTEPVSVLLLVLEWVRTWRRQRFSLWLIHHNGLYRVELVVLAICLLGDSIWYWVSGPDNNYLLTLGLLVGWWFCTFFLRPLRKFSFFTVMLQKVLLGDMLRFSTIIVLELLTFTVAMYVTFEATPGPPPDGFEHFGVALMTMFQLMLGLSEVEVLYEASHPWVAVTLFVLFVLLTYVLVLNALIAMMSNTCSLVSEEKESQWELQRLSVVLMLESMMPCDCMQYNSGRPLHVAIFRGNKVVKELRYFTKVTSVQTSYTDGAAILKRKALMQTNQFQEIHAIMASADDVGHVDLLATFAHQQALLSTTDHFLQDESLDPPEQGDIYLPYHHGEKGFHSHREAVGKPGPPSHFRPKSNMPMIQESPEGQRSEEARSQDEGLGNTSYASVRENLMKTLRVGQFASRMSHLRAPSQRGRAASPHFRERAPAPSDNTTREADGDSDTDDRVDLWGEDTLSPPPNPLTPHTPKSVRLKVAATPSVASPGRIKSHRKRHNSEGTARDSQHAARFSTSDKSKSLEFPSGEGEPPSQQPRRLSPFGSRMEERLRSSSLLVRQTSKVQPLLLSPDVLDIDPKTSQANSDA